MTQNIHTCLHVLIMNRFIYICRYQFIYLFICEETVYMGTWEMVGELGVSASGDTGNGWGAKGKRTRRLTDIEIRHLRSGNS